ncbi:MAG: ABC transporter substrate-binding protein, partial [Rhizobiales bacterium]|nr:ABC transporter substrate-binding protein [Hyphomicrobiales bacterium]
MRKLSRRGMLGLTAAAVSATFTDGLRTPVSAADPIKLGASLSLTGRFSDSAKYCQEGYLLWSEQVNAKGGIGGRQVQIVIYDDESNPDTGRVLAERLIDRDGATVILGPYSSPITDAIGTA